MAQLQCYGRDALRPICEALQEERSLSTALGNACVAAANLFLHVSVSALVPLAYLAEH